MHANNFRAQIIADAWDSVTKLYDCVDSNDSLMNRAAQKSIFVVRLTYAIKFDSKFRAVKDPLYTDRALLEGIGQEVQIRQQYPSL